MVLGPTGTGKSELAVGAAFELGGEIVGFDALQVYRGFDAATAKPSHADRGRVPHHLVDCVDPREDFSMARFVDEADRAIGEVAQRAAVPVVVGGTGMYLRGLLRGIVPSPPRDAKLRDRIRGMAQRHGRVALHRWLRRLDPGAAEGLPAADVQRVARAIEYALLQGGPWSRQLERHRTWDSSGERYDALKIGLKMEREELYRRLERRVDRFFDEADLVGEVRQLLEAGVPREANAFKAIGYREVLAALERGDDPESVREAVKTSTRRYAKRQETWFRRESGVHWLDAQQGTEGLLARTLELWRAHHED